MTRYALLIAGQSNGMGVNGPLGGKVKATGLYDSPPDSGMGGPEEPHPRISMISVGFPSTIYPGGSAGGFQGSSGDLIQARCPIQSPTMIDQSSCFGFHMAKAMIGELNDESDEIVIINYSIGGASVMAGPFGTWYPGRTPMVSTFNHYASMVPFVQAVVAQHTLELCGLLWMQGEQDAVDGNPDYGEELEFLFSSMRSDFSSPNLPIIVGTMTQTFQSLGPNIHQAHIDIASNVTNSATAAMLDLATDSTMIMEDNTHYTRDAHRIMGQRYLDAFRQLDQHVILLQVPTPPPTPAVPTPAPTPDPRLADCPIIIPRVVCPDRGVYSRRQARTMLNSYKSLGAGWQAGMIVVMVVTLLLLYCGLKRMMIPAGKM